MGTLELSYFSHRGMVRPQNEDSFLVVPPWREPALSRQVCLFAVADGMGGHAKGEVASGIAVDTLRRAFASQPAQPLTIPMIENVVSEANQAVFEHSRKYPECQGMGTTLTAALVGETQAWIAHVGDSRAYLLREGKLRQLTADHSLVAEQVRAGLLSPEAARTHPARHIISRALGVREFVNVDTHQIDLIPGDVICLMSDGVSGQVPDDDIGRHLGTPDFSRVAKGLVASANAAGGPDNSTVVAIRIDEVPLRFPPKISWNRFRSVVGEWWNA